MTNQLITYRLPIDYSLISLMSLMSSIYYAWYIITNANQTNFFGKFVQGAVKYEKAHDRVNLCLPLKM